MFVSGGVVGGIVVVIGAMVVALAFLVGVAVIVGGLSDRRLEPFPAFFVGFAVVALAAWAYVELWPDPWTGVPALAVSGVAVVMLIVLPPAVALGIGLYNGDGSSLTPEGGTGSELEVIVLSGDAGPVSPAEATSHGWSVKTWTGRVQQPADADWSVDWGERGPPPPVPAADVDRVLVLQPGKDVGPWLRVADSVTSPATPTLAVLNGDQGALESAWKAALSGNGITRRRGKAIVRDALSPKAMADLAVELVELSPTGDQDLALAAQHRPALFFDGSEKTPLPYNVDELIKSGKMRLCAPGQSRDLLCPIITTASQLHRDAGRLTFDPDELARITNNPTEYVHIRHTGNDHPEAIYLDYWWYFPYNAADAGERAFCGAGLNLAGTTCFDHQSDWEGVTVVLDGDDPTGPPTAVLYAQHNRVLRYSWRALQEIWDQGTRGEFGKGIDASRRPLVFVASGTHASYPVSCKGSGGESKCSALHAPGRPKLGIAKDNRRDGAQRWSGNTTACLPACLTAFPSRHRGERRASWNAFAGNWGTADCVLGVICNQSTPPQGPGEQNRYKKPWCWTRAFEFDREEAKRACEEERKPRSVLAGGHKRVVALGDSFSSGQGAGDYRPGTDGGGNTCYRSDRAWPLLMAERLDWITVGFLACSSAISAEVIRDRAGHNSEAERAHSQIGRIAKDPDVLTLTIGGNDVGFASVVSDCVFLNCKAIYHKRSGDVLDRRIDKLGERLPGVYEAIKRAAPRAKLVVVDYPRLLPQGSPELERDNCAAPGLGTVTATEVEYLNEKTERLDRAIESAATASGADFVDVIDAFDGHELRCHGQPFVNPARGEGKLRPASFHPNAAGYVQLADVVARELATRSP
jgi:lysophospholipase L1-like esterase